MVKRKVAVFKGGMSPIAKGVKTSIAASIGRTITRYSYLEWVMGNCLHTLLEISIKQRRVAVRIPPTRLFVGMVQDLLAFHRGKASFDFVSLQKKLEAADKARNVLAHSVLINANGKIHIQIVSGSWELPQDVERVTRALMPETPVVDAKFLKEKRRAVEDGIRAIRKLEAFLGGAMHTLHEMRRTKTEWNRRRQGQN